MGRIIVIGDVHGMYVKLIDLMKRIKPETGDRVIFVGDLLDRGPGSDRVINYVRKNCYDCVCGNHEQMAIDAQQSKHWNDTWLFNGGATTLSSYHGKEDQLASDIEWMKTLPFHITIEEKWIISHAGIPQGNTLASAENSDMEGCRAILWHRGELEQLKYIQVIGHTPIPNPILEKQGIHIDTGAFAGGPLTAVDLNQRSIIQSR